MSAPVFRVQQSQDTYNSFFEITRPENISSHIGNLDSIVKLAREAAHALIVGVQLPLPEGRHRVGALPLNQRAPALQTYYNNLSDVKRRIAQAIIHKREYYEATWMGTITKFVLKLFCLWNNGSTPAIRNAEAFLFENDSRYPLIQHGNRYKPCATWHANAAGIEIDFSNFYNYDAPRMIEIEGDPLPSFQNALLPHFMRRVP